MWNRIVHIDRPTKKLYLDLFLRMKRNFIIVAYSWRQTKKQNKTKWKHKMQRILSVASLQRLIYFIIWSSWDLGKGTRNAHPFSTLRLNCHSVFNGRKSANSTLVFHAGVGIIWQSKWHIRRVGCQRQYCRVDPLHLDNAHYLCARNGGRPTKNKNYIFSPAVCMRNVQSVYTIFGISLLPFTFGYTNSTHTLSFLRAANRSLYMSV